MSKDIIEYSQPIGDRAVYTTCYMCACRCGIKVHLKDGRLRYIEGNRDHLMTAQVAHISDIDGKVVTRLPLNVERLIHRVRQLVVAVIVRK